MRSCHLRSCPLVREKFEVQSADRRCPDVARARVERAQERTSSTLFKKLKKEKVKAAKKAKKAFEQTQKEKGLMGKIGHRKRKAEAAACRPRPNT